MIFCRHSIADRKHLSLTRECLCAAGGRQVRPQAPELCDVLLHHPPRPHQWPQLSPAREWSDPGQVTAALQASIYATVKRGKRSAGGWEHLNEPRRVITAKGHWVPPVLTASANGSRTQERVRHQFPAVLEFLPQEVCGGPEDLLSCQPPRGR